MACRRARRQRRPALSLKAAFMKRKRKTRPCAACGKPVGTATIVAGGEFPDAPLCARCGLGGPHTCEETEAMIRARLANGGGG